jgi:hypothetical protein
VNDDFRANKPFLRHKRPFKSIQAPWKTQILESFNQHELSTEKSEKLKKLLLSLHNTENKTQTPPHNAEKRWGSNHINLTSATYKTIQYFAVAAASLILFVNLPANTRDWFFDTFDFIQIENSEVATIEELASQPSSKVFPADFDLEGDPSSFQEIMTSITGSNETFSAEIPADIRQKWSPKEGRLFSWAGAAGVSIELSMHTTTSSALGAKAAPNEKLSDSNSPAVLYIVRLSEKSAKKFPKNKLNRKIATKSGKSKKVNVWREGTYGYAFVETVSFSDSN